MTHGCNRYVKVYQGTHHVRSVGGKAGQKLIKEFWNNKNPRSAIVRSLKINEKVTFPDIYINLPYLIYSKGIQPNDTVYYTGNIYLVEIQKRSDKRRIRNIYIAEYYFGNLIRLCHIIPNRDDIVWYNKDDLKHINIEIHYRNNELPYITMNAQALKVTTIISNPTETVQRDYRTCN